MEQDGRSARYRRTFRLRPVVAAGLVFIVTFMSLVTWSLSDPLVAAPDEQAHIIRAYALDHGQLGSPAYFNPITNQPTTTPSNVEVNVTVPYSIYFTKLYASCWQFHDTRTASCSPSWSQSYAPIVTNTYVGHYPPLYYAFVGMAGWFSAGPDGIYSMRILSDLLGAAMLGVAAYVIAKWGRRSSWFGLVLSLTPLAYFLSSSVNPSGFEIMTAICFWTIITTLGLQRRDDPPVALVVIFTVVTGILMSIRGLSTLWAAFGGLSLLILLGPRRIVALVRTRRDVRWAGYSLAAVGALALTWVTTQGTLHILPVGYPVSNRQSNVEVLHYIWHFWHWWQEQIVGVLGWLDTYLPHRVYFYWQHLFILVVAVALLCGSWRVRGLVALLTISSFLLPVLITFHAARVNGVTWQGRDSYPLEVGLFIVAAGALSERVLNWVAVRIALTLAIAGLAVAGVEAFFANLRRYAVGRYGPWNFFLHNQGWSPPIGRAPALLLATVGIVGLAALLTLWIWFSPARPMVTAETSHTPE